MVRIADIVGSLSHCFEAQRELELCRRRAQGDVEYFSYSYQQDFKQAQMDLEHALNVYIDPARRAEAGAVQHARGLRTVLASRPCDPVGRLTSSRAAPHAPYPTGHASAKRFVGTDVAARR